MIKLLIGPALALIAWGIGSYYGRNAEQLVHKSPDTVYAALSNMVAESAGQEATITRDDGRKIATALTRGASDPGKNMTIQLLFDGRPGVSADVALTPQDDGKATLMKVRLHGDHGLLRDALAGTKQARLAYAPDWLLNITFRPVLKNIAEDIEGGRDFARMSAFESEAEREAQLSADQQQQMSEWRQYESTQPMTDPNADAQRYMSGGN